MNPNTKSVQAITKTIAEDDPFPSSVITGSGVGIDEPAGQYESINQKPDFVRRDDENFLGAQ